MNRTPAIAIALLFLTTLATLPGAGAQEERPLVTMVVNDAFHDIPVEDLVLDPGCAGGAFEVLADGRGFRFFEVPEATQNPLFNNQDIETGSGTELDGFVSTGCGTASYPVTVPAGIDHFHVRFSSSRTIVEAQQVDPDLNEPGVNAVQRVGVRDAAGQEFAVRHYVDPLARSIEERYYDPLRFDPPVQENVTVEWYFEDQAHFTQNFPDAYSGVDFQATVTEPEIEFSFLPADDHSIVESSVQSGTEVVRQSVVVSRLDPDTVGRFDRINVRVQTAGTPELVQVVLPDGSVLDQPSTRGNSGPKGYDPDLVLVEHLGDSSWFTVPYGIVADQGAGDYTFVIQESQGLVVSAGLVPVAAGIVLLPLVASAFAIHGTVRFRREAFGGFQRAATWLVVAIGVLLAYYLMVMVSAIITGTINRMVVTPFDAAAWLLYMQVSIAAAGFIVVFIVGRELYRITVPRKTS